ncbi:MAG TPA: prepilin-type N-terminal cleavage/methylation domain-containing protein [Planctomycetota bacterium]|nr:prepilin-type N-terminal cleavage/methylation domain-containing protein [Planctomycetota bacterium]
MQDSPRLDVRAGERRRRHGFTTIELALALTILAFVMSMFTTTVIAMLR